MNIKDFIPPIVLKARRRWIDSKKTDLDIPITIRREREGPKTPRACHFEGLFVNRDGDVYPCDDVWMYEHMRMGNIADPDLKERITRFSQPCHCERFTLMPGGGQNFDYGLLNIEFSLACQGGCAMCCVDAPSWKGKYDLYGKLTELMEWTRPRSMLVQGGEVLIQKKTIAWLEEQKQRFPDLQIKLISNGNVGLDMAPVVERLFYEVVISMVGFQPETYAKIMEMDVEKTKRFVERLIAGGITRVTAKLLTTPLSFHEADVFLKWAIDAAPYRCVFQDSGTVTYLHMGTKDAYFQKIMDRTGHDLRKTIQRHYDAMAERGMLLQFDTRCRGFYGITEEFIGAYPKVVGWLVQ